MSEEELAIFFADKKWKPPETLFLSGLSEIYPDKFATLSKTIISSS